uniref:Protein S100 n=1 Tax=Bothriechis nigroviridis TaxID=88079 RepID=A0A6B2F5N5_BOTNI
MSSRYTAGPTETERCIETLLAVFQGYAENDSNSQSLSKQGFQNFMNTELASFTKNQKDPAVIDRMMKKLDMNCDGQVDFCEFLNLIGGLAQACHEHVASAPGGEAPRRM